MALGNGISKLIYYYAIYLRLKFIMFCMGSNMQKLQLLYVRMAIEQWWGFCYSLVCTRDGRTRKMEAWLRQIGEIDFVFSRKCVDHRMTTTEDDDDVFAHVDRLFRFVSFEMHRSQKLQCVAIWIILWHFAASHSLSLYLSLPHLVRRPQLELDQSDRAR